MARINAVILWGNYSREEIRQMANKPDKVKKAPEVDPEQEDLTSEDPEESEERRAQRQKEWGHQFDMWLIRCARKHQPVELLLAVGYPGVTRDKNLVNCVPIRVDKYMIEVSVDGLPVWIQKLWIIGVKPLGGKVREAGENGSQSSAE